MVITFSMGTWVSGLDLYHLATELAIRLRRHAAVVAPGENLPEALEVLQRLGPHYPRVFVVGNAPFLRQLLEAGLDWPALRVTIGTGAEATAEAWREWACRRIGADPDREPMRVFNVYGALDFGLDTATETPLTIAIKRRAIRDPAQPVPVRPQPDLLRGRGREVGRHLLVGRPPGTLPRTRPGTGADLRRDGRGPAAARVRPVCGAAARRLSHAAGPLDGRSDGTVSIGGANIYPGNVETAVLEDETLSRAVEHFQLAVEEDVDLRPHLKVYIGVREGYPPAETGARAAEAIHAVLMRENTEYAATYLGNPSVRSEVVALPADSLAEAGIKRHHVRPQQHLFKRACTSRAVHR